MTDPQTLLRLFEVELDRLEGDMARHLRGVTPHVDFSAEGYIQDYGRLLELQAMVSSRRVEITTAQGPRETPPAQHLHSRGVMSVINDLILYHDTIGTLKALVRWSTSNHRHAAETLKLIRDRLGSCYEVRS